MNIGNKEIIAAYIGDTQVDRIYLGDTLVYGEGGPTPTSDIRLNETNDGLIFPAGSYSTTTETSYYIEDPNAGTFERTTGIMTVTFAEETEVDARSALYNVESKTIINPSTNSWSTTTQPSYYCCQGSLADTDVGFTSVHNQSVNEWGDVATGSGNVRYYNSAVLFVKTNSGNSGVKVTSSNHLAVKFNIDYLLGQGYTWKHIPVSWMIQVEYNRGYNNSCLVYPSFTDSYGLNNSQISMGLYDANGVNKFTATVSENLTNYQGHYVRKFNVPSEYENYEWQLGDYLLFKVSPNTTIQADGQQTWFATYPVYVSIIPNTYNYVEKIQASKNVKVGFEPFITIGQPPHLEEDHENVWDLGYLKTSDSEAYKAEGYYKELPAEEAN